MFLKPRAVLVWDITNSCFSQRVNSLETPFLAWGEIAFIFLPCFPESIILCMVGNGASRMWDLAAQCWASLSPILGTCLVFWG